MRTHTKIMLGVVGGSFVLHLAAWGFVGRIKGERKHDLIAIELADAKKKKKKEEEKPKPKPVEVKPEKAKVRAPAPKVDQPLPQPVAPPPDAKPQSMSSYADLGLGPMSGGNGPGLAVGGGGGGGGGGGSGPVAPAPTVTQRHVSLAAPEDSCTEELVKPKLEQFIKPPYTDAGRQANIEGSVRLEITVDASGHVVSVKVLRGLGYGLDEAAINTAKTQWSFKPGTRCGKAVPATVKATVTFALS